MSDLNQFEDQTQRIKSKLIEARKCDPEYKVFGSQIHKYEIGPPIEISEVTKFERQHGITLPLDYVAFLTQVGHGSPMKGNTAAGPFYGLFTLDDVSAEIESPAALSVPPLFPSNTGGWEESFRHVEIYDGKGVYPESGNLYSGVVRIGHQGGQDYHVLVVIGAFSGLV